MRNLQDLKISANSADSLSNTNPRLLYSILFYSILFYSILFYSTRELGSKTTETRIKRHSTVFGITVKVI